MATKRQRIQVTLSDEVWLLVDEIHRLSGTPKSAVIGEMLDTVAPAITAQMQALRMLHENPREAQRLMQNFVNEGIAQAAQATLDLDKAIGDARSVKGKRAKTGGLRGRTP